MDHLSSAQIRDDVGVGSQVAITFCTSHPFYPSILAALEVPPPRPVVPCFILVVALPIFLRTDRPSKITTTSRPAPAVELGV